MMTLISPCIDDPFILKSSALQGPETPIVSLIDIIFQTITVIIIMIEDLPLLPNPMCVACIDIHIGIMLRNLIMISTAL